MSDPWAPLIYKVYQKSGIAIPHNPGPGGCTHSSKKIFFLSQPVLVFFLWGQWHSTFLKELSLLLGSSDFSQIL